MGNNKTCTDKERHSLLMGYVNKSGDVASEFFLNLFYEIDSLYYFTCNFSVGSDDVGPESHCVIYYLASIGEPFWLDIETAEKHIHSFFAGLKKMGLIKRFGVKRLNLEESKTYLSERIFNQDDYAKNVSIVSLIENDELAYFEIKVVLNNSKKNILFLQKFFDSNMAEKDKYELYSEYKQREIIKKYILKKQKDFDKSVFMLNVHFLNNIKQLDSDENDFDDSIYVRPRDVRHIKIMRTLRALEKKKDIKIKDVYYSSHKREPHCVRIEVSKKWLIENKKNKENQKWNTLLFDFKKEKEAMEEIGSGTQHRIFRDKWLNRKRVLDVINDLLSLLPPNPVGKEDMQSREIIVEKSAFFEKEIPQEKDDVIYNILLFLEERDIIEIKKLKMDDAIYEAEDSKGLFLNGKVAIIVKSIDIFEKHLTGLSAFVSQIEKDGQYRFSTEYRKKSTTVVNLKDSSTSEALKNKKGSLRLKIGYADRRITINNITFAKPHFHGVNDLIFSYLYDNPEKLIKKEDLRKAIGIDFRKDFNTFLNEIKIKGKIRESFFDYSKTGIKLKALEVIIKKVENIKKVRAELEKVDNSRKA